MSNWKTIDEDGLPPAGVPLIVTVANENEWRNGPKIVYPVIYRKSFIRDEWGFYEHGMEDGLIGPDFFRVTAWQELPRPYDGKKDAAPHCQDMPPQWVSVEEALPEKGHETWVYVLPPDGIDVEPTVDSDTYDGNRGEIVKFLGLAGDVEVASSGWRVYNTWNITHWMPTVKPEPPK